MGVEGRTLKAIHECKALLDQYPVSWEKLILPTIASQRVGSFLVLESYKKMYEKGLIQSPADFEILRFIATQKGTKAWDILENLVLAGADQRIIQTPLSSQEALLEEFLSYERYPIVEVYREFKRIKAQGLNPGAERQAIEDLFGRMQALQGAVVSGELMAAQENDPAFAAVLMHVFPPATTTQRVQYLNLYKGFKDHPAHIPREVGSLQGRIMEVATGGYALKEGEEVDTASWSMLLALVKEGNQGAARRSNLIKLGKSLMEGLRDRNLGKEDVRKKLLEGLYQHFRDSRGAQLPEDLAGYAHLMGYKGVSGRGGANEIEGSVEQKEGACRGGTQHGCVYRARWQALG